MGARDERLGMGLYLELRHHFPWPRLSRPQAVVVQLKKRTTDKKFKYPYECLI